MKENIFKTIVTSKKYTAIAISVLVAIITLTTCLCVLLLPNNNDTSDQLMIDSLFNIKTLESAACNVGLSNKEISDDLTTLASQLNNALDGSMHVVVSDNKMTTVQKDAWGNPFNIYYSKPSDNSGLLEIVSAGPDGVLDTDDDIVSKVLYEYSDDGNNVSFSSPDVMEQYETSHVCLFNVKTVSDITQVNSGTCVSKAVYYYSCLCGKVGTTTFSTLVNASNHTAIIEEYLPGSADKHNIVAKCQACSVVVSTTAEEHKIVGNICVKCNFSTHVHNFVKNINPTYLFSKATCDAQAQYYYSCACGVKGDELFTVGEPLTHEFITTVQSPTCLDEGLLVSTCSLCNYSVEEKLDALGHSWTQVKNVKYLYSKATCCSPAKYYESCSACGIHNDMLFEEGSIDATNHDGTLRNVYDFSSDSKHVVNVYCNGCNVSIKKLVEDHDFDSTRVCVLCNNHVHEFIQKDNLKLKSAATCQRAAQYYYNCLCGELGSMSYEYGSVDKTNHTGYVMYGGTINTHTLNSCCGTVVSQEHKFMISTNQPTCTSTGLKTYACECGYLYTEVLNLVNHNFVESVENGILLTPATCVSGAVYYVSCSTCNLKGDATFATTQINSTNHSSATYEEYVYIDNDRHNVDIKCVDCKTVLNAVISKHEIQDGQCKWCRTHIHNFSRQDNLKLRLPATCTTQASYYYNCDCGLINDMYYFYGDLDAANHTSEELQLVGQADVHSIYACCGEIAQRNHQIETKITKPATCDNKGIMLYYCNCGYEYKEEVARLEHMTVQIPSETSQKTVATCIAPAVYYESCKHCGMLFDTTFSYGTLNNVNHVEEEKYTYEPSSNSNEHVVMIQCAGCNVLKASYTKEHLIDETSNCSLCNFHIHKYVLQNNLQLYAEATCLSPALYFYNCVCGATGPESYTYGQINPNNHLGTIYYVGERDICTAYACCKALVSDNHEFDKSIVVDVSCEQDGLTRYTCQCGFSYDETIPHSGHSYVEKVPADRYQKTTATCLSPATFYYSCKCGAHTDICFKSGTVNPDNHAGGIVSVGTFNTCKIYICCETPATSGHDFVEVESVESTCIIRGYTVMACDCGYSYQIPGNLAEHKYINAIKDNKYLKNEATCLLPKAYYYSCDCGAMTDAYFEVDKPLGHQLINGGEEYAHLKCTRCNFADAKHNFAETILVKPSCSIPGQKLFECACGYSTITELAASGHIEQTNLHPCTEDTVCRDCGIVLALPTGHHYDTAGFCSVCQAEMHRHNFVETIAEEKYLKDAATCQGAAQYYYSCACGQVGTITFTFGNIDKTNHTGSIIYGNTINTCTKYSCCDVLVSNHIYETNRKEATCYNTGSCLYTCNVCQYSYTETLPILEHLYTAVKKTAEALISEANCTRGAIYYYSCEYCSKLGSETFTEPNLNATNHVGDRQDEYQCVDDDNHLVVTVCLSCASQLNTRLESHSVTSTSRECVLCQQHIHSFTAMNTSERYQRIKATCFSDASYYYSCECGTRGTNYFVVQDSKLTHEFTRKAAVAAALYQKATCINSAMYFKSCVYCETPDTNPNNTFIIGPVNPHVHYSDDYTITAIVIDEKHHNVIYSCSACSVKINETVEEHSLDAFGSCTVCIWTTHTHNYNQSLISDKYQKSVATCTEPAYYYYSCECGSKGVTTFAHGSALGHSFVTVGSSRVHELCQNCNFINENHIYTETIITNATCKVTGRKNLTCSCGSSKIINIPTSEHIVSDNLPTCAGPTFCITCKAIVREQTDHVYDINDICVKCGVAQHKHIYQQRTNAEALRTSATCLRATTYYYSCECGHKDTSFFSVGQPLGHNTVFVGSELVHTKCTRCGEIDGKHSLTRTIVYSATCKESGEERLTCSCGYATNLVIPRTNHVPTIVPAPCQTDTFCLNCGQRMSYKMDHFYDDFGNCVLCGAKYHVHTYSQILKPRFLRSRATCSMPATYYYGCECGEIERRYYRVGIAEQHIFSEGGKQYEHRKCMLCGYVDLQHTFQEMITSNPTCRKAGQKVYQCNCGYSFSVLLPMLPHTALTVSNSCQSDTVCVDCGMILQGRTEHVASPNVQPCLTSTTCMVCGLKLRDKQDHEYNTAGFCVWCNLQRHEHEFNPIIGEDYLHTKATCVEPATYFKSCACGELDKTYFEAGQPEHVLNTLGQCIYCDFVDELWLSIHKISTCSSSHPLCQKMKEMYGSNSDILYSLSPNAQLKYTTSIVVDNIQYTVYVSGKPGVANEHVVSQCTSTHPLCQYMKEMYGSNSNVIYSLTQTSNTPYCTSIAVDGVMYTVYTSGKPGK